NNVVFLQEQGSSAGSYLAQLNRQIATLRTQLQLLQRLDPEQWVDAESRHAATNSGEPPEASARETLASLAGPQADLFKASQQMQLLKAKRDELGRFLRPLHPKITKLNEEIATQEKLVGISRDEALRQLANRRQALQLEIKNLESAFQEWDLKAIESSRLSAEVLGQIPAISLPKAKGQLGMQFLERQRFEFLESFRNIRSSLLYMSNGASRPKTILITSSVPREGKSTVALYLSATMAMGDSRVLLIDGDMRRSSLHKFFGARSGPGLAEILSREVSPALAIIPSSVEKLSLLPAGAAKRNPGELVLSSEWTRFIGELYPQFDYILIDSPPLLATDDAASLAPKLVGVL